MKRNQKITRTVLVIAGILTAYVQQMAPSPILLSIRDAYSLGGSDTLLNLAVSIIFPTIIAASLVGVSVEKKIGTYNLYSLALLLLGAGACINYVASGYTVFLIGRLIYGAGFGLAIPFIGSAIMIWYTGSERDAMNTINGLFPFFGTTIAFCVMDRLRIMFGGSVGAAMGIWGPLSFVVLALWVLLKRKLDYSTSEPEDSEAPRYNVYKKILKFREIRLLCVIFMCDFFCYSYLSVVLPTMLFEAGEGLVSESGAGMLAAVAFPIVGIAGCMLGGVVSNRLGKRRPVIYIGQSLKFISLFIIWFCRTSVPGIIIGSAFFGFGNGFWMPAMYSMPMDIRELNASDVGAVFAFVSSCGFVCGFFSPMIGGFLSDMFVNIFSGSPQPVHVSAMALSLLIFNVVDLLSVICGVALHETGPGRK